MNWDQGERNLDQSLPLLSDIQGQGTTTNNQDCHNMREESLYLDRALQLDINDQGVHVNPRGSSQFSDKNSSAGRTCYPLLL